MNTLKTSRLAKIEARQQYEYSGVIYYPFSVEFENGDNGTIYSKSQSSGIILGETYDYTLEQKANGIRVNISNSKQDKSELPQKDRIIIRQVAFKGVIELVAAGIKIENLKERVDEYQKILEDYDVK